MTGPDIPTVIAEPPWLSPIAHRPKLNTTVLRPLQHRERLGDMRQCGEPKALIPGTTGHHFPKASVAHWRRAEATGQGPMPYHSRMSYTGALKVRHFHRVRRPTVLEGVEDISTKRVSLPHRTLGLPTIRSSMARRNRITVHSLPVLLPALLVLPISHTYRLLISQLAVNTSLVTEVNPTLHPRHTPRINLHHHHPDQSTSGMAIAFLLRSDQTLDRNTQVLPRSYRIGNNHYLLYRLPNLHLRHRLIHRPLLRLHRSRQVEMRSLLMLPQHLRNLTRKEFQHLGIQGKESLIVHPPCRTNYLLYRITHQTVVRASHLQLSIADLLG